MPCDDSTASKLISAAKSLAQNLRLQLCEDRELDTRPHAFLGPSRFLLSHITAKDSHVSPDDCVAGYARHT